MDQATEDDPFVSSEPEVEVDAETSQVLRERIETAEDGRLVSAENARKRIHQWLTRLSITTKR
jgi:hypothetical protein